MTTYEPADWRPQPGDVAEVEWNRTDRPQVRILADVGELRWWGGGGFVYDAAVRVVRRLQVVDPASVVTLDPDNPDDLLRFRAAVTEYARPTSTAKSVLRSLLPTPPLPEPNGLGAVVKGTTADDSGATWVRAIRNGGPAVWALSIPDTAGRERWWLWSAMRVTEVVSHGVGCTCGGPGCPGGSS